MGRRLRGDSGFNVVQAGLVLALVAVGYFGWIYLPVYIEHQKLRTLVREGCAKAYSHRRLETVTRTIVNGFPAIGMVDRFFADGVLKEAPTPFGDRNLEVEFSRDKNEVSATVYYERRLVWPLLNREEVMEFTISHTEDLSPIRY